MTNVERLLRVVESFVKSPTDALTFAQDYHLAFTEGSGSDPYQLWDALQELFYETGDFLDFDPASEEAEARAAEELRAKAQTAYDVAVDVVARWGGPKNV